MSSTFPSPAVIRRVLSAGAVALALAACGDSSGNPGRVSPSPSSSPVPSAPLVTPPPATSITALDASDVLALARAHRIKTAVVSATTVSGTMASDIAPQQQYSAPAPTGAALTTLLKALRDGGAVVTMASGRAPAA